MRKIFLDNFQLLATLATSDIVDGDHDDNEYDDNDNANDFYDNYDSANHSADDYDRRPPCSQISAYPPLPEKVLP